MQVLRLIMVPVEGDLKVDELMDLKQAAKFLGLSEKSLLRLLAEEKVPARKLRGKWRFTSDSLKKWIGEGDSQAYAKYAVVDENESDED